MNELLRYFPELTLHQREQFAALGPLYETWNARINVISRKDIGSLYLKHVLHSLAIARACWFDTGARILDIGCGGGFPSIPLAILFPKAQFTATDSIGKKITVVREIASAIGLTNLSALHIRSEETPGRFDYAVSRAVAEMQNLLKWGIEKIDRGQKGSLPNGMLVLKGGGLDQELAATGRKYTIYPISEWFTEEFFETKKVIWTEKR